jgi:hypothetical protein
VTPFSKRHTGILFLLWFVSFSFSVSAQNTTRRSPVRYVNEYETDRNQQYKYVDSSMNETEIFHAMYQKQVIFQDLGNIGSPGRNAFFSVNREVGFNATFNPFENYFINRNGTRYYNTTKPFTELFYAQGKQELLFLKAKHSQNILPRWNVGLDFQRIVSEGFFLHQKTGMYNIQLNTRLLSKNKRYELLGYAMWNRGSVQENGGIASDSAFEALSGSNKSVTVNMATTENRYRQRSLFIKQYYKFGSPVNLVKGEDSLYDFNSRAHIAYTLRTDESRFIFVNNGDSMSELLPMQYFDTVPGVTRDSLYTGLIENKLSIQLFGGSAVHNRFLSVGIMHQGATVAQPSYLRNFQNVIADAQFEWVNNNNGSLSIWADGAYTVSGYNKDNYKLNGLVRYRTRLFNLLGGITRQQFTPDYQLIKYYSNQFIWDNSFKQTQVFTGKATLNTRTFRNNFSLSVTQHVITNYAYLNNRLLAEQASGTANVLQVQLNKTFQLGKFFFKHQLYYQHSDAKYIPVPELGGMARYYFQTNLYTSVIQLGFDVFYNTAYHSMNWSPATRMFYVQDQVKTGNYPLADPFLCMQIKRAVVFFKFEHANQNLINEGFYNTPHYPVSLRSFRFGIKWRMYD